jgi:hypothetical protein
MRRLKTTTEVVEFLGGDAAVAALFTPNPQLNDTKVVSNWRYFGIFPANTYVELNKALDKKNAYAPDALWNMKTGASP